MSNKFLILLLGIFLLNFSSALDCWATFDKNTEIQLLQICPTCSYVNITSITYPDGTVFLNEEMEKNGANFNYTLPDNSQFGTISYVTLGDKNGANPPMQETLCIKIGTELSTSESIIYAILSLGILLLSVITFYFMMLVPYSNELNEKGNLIMRVTRTKYIKLGLILITYGLFTWFLNIMIGLAENFASLTMYYGLFGGIFWIMNALSLPVSIVILVIMLFEIVRDANIQKKIKALGSATR